MMYVHVFQIKNDMNTTKIY